MPLYLPLLLFLTVDAGYLLNADLLSFLMNWVYLETTPDLRSFANSDYLPVILSSGIPFTEIVALCSFILDASTASSTFDLPFICTD